jgi:hypothetical protein
MEKMDAKRIKLVPGIKPERFTLRGIKTVPNPTADLVRLNNAFPMEVFLGVSG